MVTNSNIKVIKVEWVPYKHVPMGLGTGAERKPKQKSPENAGN